MAAPDAMQCLPRSSFLNKYFAGESYMDETPDAL